MELRKGYKRTEIGVIPDDWELLLFGMLINYVKGFPFRASDYRNDGIRILRVSDMNYNGIKESAGVYVDDNKGTDFAKWKLEENDLVFTTVGSKPPMYDSLVGKAILINKEYSGSLLNQNAVIIRANSKSEHTQRFLLNHFRTARYIRYIEIIHRGNANQASITLKELFEYKIPFPKNSDEQKTIAEALSDIDTLKDGLEKLIVKKRKIKQGAIQELLTGKRKLKSMYSSWHEIALKEIVDQFIVPMRNKPKIFCGDVPWCRIEDFNGKFLYGSKSNQNVNREIIDQMNLKVFPIETLIVSCSADLGKCAILKNALVTNQTFIGLIVNKEKGSTEFLYYFMSYNSEKLNQLSSGTTISYLSRAQFENMQVKVPKTKIEQMHIAQILSDLDAEIAALETKLEKYRNIKQGMMQNLLTGKIRLI